MIINSCYSVIAVKGGSHRRVRRKEGEGQRWLSILTDDVVSRGGSHDWLTARKKLTLASLLYVRGASHWVAPR